MMTEDLRVAIERQQTARLWGQLRRIKPRLVDEVFGDGLRLLALSPIDDRPNYYVVRIGSDWDLDDFDHDGITGLRDRLDDIRFAIEEQFGRRCEDPRTGEDCEKDTCLKCNRGFPLADFGSGCEWWEIDWPQTNEEKPKPCKTCGHQESNPDCLDCGKGAP
jgi:hypothetical protein